MLQQVLFTRCLPYRKLYDDKTGLIGDGSLVQEEGYTIYNYSEGMLELGKSMDLELADICMGRGFTNASADSPASGLGMFESYAYYPGDADNSILINDSVYPFDPTAPKLGKKNHIKHSVVGAINNYPCLLFKAEMWKAFRKPAMKYFSAGAQMLPYLPEVGELYYDKEAVMEKAHMFISAGRQDCFKQLVAVVLGEMSKPIEKRKFIVIKDTPENVEMWITALELALPRYIAGQISFNTNVSVIRSSKLFAENNEYFCDSNNKIMNIPLQKAYAAGGRRRLYSMIVGIHPADSHASSYVSGCSDEFHVLDGMCVTIDNKEGYIYDIPYFESASLLDEDISDFNSLLEELKHVDLANEAVDIFELFDAYKYLLDGSSNPALWEYEAVLRALSFFKKYDSKHKWGKYLVRKVYTIYSRLMDQDMNNNLQLLEIMTEMDNNTETSAAMEKLWGNICVSEIKKSEFSVERASNFYLKGVKAYPALLEYLREEVRKLVPVFSKNAEGYYPDMALFVITRVFESFSAEEKDSSDWTRVPENAKLIEQLIDNVCRALYCTKDILVLFKDSPLYLDVARKIISRDFAQGTKMVGETVSDAKLEMVCGAVLGYEDMTEERYESFLVTLLESGKIIGTIFKFLEKSVEKFGLNDNSSVTFMNSFLTIYGSNPLKLGRLASFLMESEIGDRAEKTAYNHITELIKTSKIDTNIISLAKDMEYWRSGLKRLPGRAYTICFINELKTIGIAQTISKYAGGEPVDASGADFNMIMDILADSLGEDEILVKTYHILGNSNEDMRKRLFFFNENDYESVFRYLRIAIANGCPPWALGFEADLEEIKKIIYEFIRYSDVEKLEKNILKRMDKSNRYYNAYYEYFEGIRKVVVEERAALKQKRN